MLASETRLKNFIFGHTKLGREMSDGVALRFCP